MRCKKTAYIVYYIFEVVSKGNDSIMTRRITEEELSKQLPFYKKVRERYMQIKADAPPLACIRTFGCQQNVADSERIKGMLARMGFGFTEDEINLIIVQHQQKIKTRRSLRHEVAPCFSKYSYSPDFSLFMPA